MSRILRTVPLLVPESRARTLAAKKVPGASCLSASIRYVPYWVSCYTFHIPRLFMKPRPMEIWIACYALTGGAFPIRIDKDVFENREAGESSSILEPSIQREAAMEKNREAAYEAFVKRYLAMREPAVELSFNELVFFPMWSIVMEGPGTTGSEVVINGRSATVEGKRRSDTSGKS